MASATRSKKRQTRLSFQPAPSSSPPPSREPSAADQSSQVRATRSASRRVAQAPLSFESSRVTRKHGLPTPVASSQVLPAAAEERGPKSDSSDNSQLSIMRYQGKRQEPRRQATDMFTPRTPRKPELPAESATPSSERQKRTRPNPLFTPSKRTKSSTAESPDLDEGKSDSDVQIISSRRKRPGNPTVIADDTDDDETNGVSDHQVPSSVGPSTWTRPKQTATSTFQAQRANGAVQEDESEEEPVTPRKRAGRAVPLNEMFSESDQSVETGQSNDTNEGPPSTSAKDRKRNEEVLEDAHDLEDTKVQDRRTRGTKPTAKSARQKQLEILKARRAGERVATPDSDSSSEAEEEDRVDRIPEPFSHARPEAEEVDDQGDWIIDDSNEDEEWRKEMPLQYSAQAHMEAKNYFKHVVEWMVHKKLNPAFTRDDELYVMSFQKIDDEAKGFAGSKFSSSIWRPMFLRALKARPEFNDVEDDSDVLPVGCEACGHTKHPARWHVSFSGRAYDPHTLEPLKDEEEDEDNEGEDDDADNQSRDVDGNVIPVERFSFQVGRHCKSNAFIAHSLLHWRWHLNDWVLGWLEAERYLTPERLVERDSWSVKKRSTFANRVVDAMEDAGEIKALRRDFKNRLEEARSRKAAAFGRADEISR